MQSGEVNNEEDIGSENGIQRTPVRKGFLRRLLTVNRTRASSAPPRDSYQGRMRRTRSQGNIEEPFEHFDNELQKAERQNRDRFKRRPNIACIRPDSSDSESSTHDQENLEDHVVVHTSARKEPVRNVHFEEHTPRRSVPQPTSMMDRSRALSPNRGGKSYRLADGTILTSRDDQPVTENRKVDLTIGQLDDIIREKVNVEAENKKLRDQHLQDTQKIHRGYTSIPISSSSTISHVKDKHIATKDLPRFSGTSYEDVSEYLLKLNRYGKLYEWTDKEFLKSLELSLDHAAMNWHETTKSSVYTWKEMQDELRKVFGKNDIDYEIQNMDNKMKLNENPVSYVMTRLRRLNETDPTATEESIVKNLFQWLPADMKAGFVRDQPKTVDGFMERLKDIDRENAFKRQAQEGTGKNAATVTSTAAKPSEKTTGYAVMTGTSEMEKALQAITQQLDRLSKQVETDSPPYRGTTVNRSRQPFRQNNRAADGQPLCNYCGKPGHIYKVCRARLNPPNSYGPRRPPPENYRGYGGNNRFQNQTQTQVPQITNEPRSQDNRAIQPNYWTQGPQVTFPPENLHQQ
jgi:hypothetical protein